jgi:HK97 family phage major capsid protein
MPELTKDQVLEFVGESVDKRVAELVKENQAKQAEQINSQVPAWFDQFRASQAAESAAKDKDHFGRMLRVIGASRGDQNAALKLAKDWYQGGQSDALVKTLTASSFTGGGAAVPTTESAEIVEFLRAAAVVRGLGPTQVPMPNGNLTMPKLTGGATATYYGEAANAVASQGTTGTLNLSAKKLITIVPISNDLLRFANPAFDAMVRQDAIAAMAAREDLAFIRGDGTIATPRGLRSWTPAANVETVNGTVNLANVTTDLGNIIRVLLDGNVRMLRPAWIFAPRTWIYLTTVRDGNGNYAFRNEMLAGNARLGANGVGSGTLWGYPYGVTTQIPITLQVTGTANESEIYLVDMADFVVGDALNVSIEVVNGAAYYASDGTLTGGFSRDESVLKIVSEHDCGMRHDESVAYFSDCDWGA